MSRSRHTFELDLPAERVELACREAVETLGWALGTGAPGLVVGLEDPAKLCCHEWPIEVEMRVSPAGAEQATVAVAGKVPGIGPISSRHLRARMSALANAIRRSAGSVI